MSIALVVLWIPVLVGVAAAAAILVAASQTAAIYPYDSRLLWNAVENKCAYIFRSRTPP